MSLRCRKTARARKNVSSRVAHVLLLRSVAGYRILNTLASKCAELIENTTNCSKAHRNLVGGSCSTVQECRIDLWPALGPTRVKPGSK